MKTCYRINKAETFDDDTSENEDDLQEMTQPYETVMNIGYKHHLTHLPTRFIFRRSDILVSSTLSVTLTPIERGFERKNLVSMDEEDLE